MLIFASGSATMKSSLPTKLACSSARRASSLRVTRWRPRPLAAWMNMEIVRANVSVCQAASACFFFILSVYVYVSLFILA